MAKTVTVYTNEIRNSMEKTYRQAETDGERFEVVKHFANMLGKSEASIRGVMSRAGYYVKKAYVAKTGEKPIKKEVLATQIGSYIGLDADQAGSLAKANRTVLKKVIQKMAADANTIKALTEGEPTS